MVTAASAGPRTGESSIGTRYLFSSAWEYVVAKRIAINMNSSLFTGEFLFDRSTTAAQRPFTPCSFYVDEHVPTFGN